jgi:hypothetical protein
MRPDLSKSDGTQPARRQVMPMAAIFIRTVIRTQPCFVRSEQLASIRGPRHLLIIGWVDRTEAVHWKMRPRLTLGHPSTPSRMRSPCCERRITCITTYVSKYNAGLLRVAIIGGDLFSPLCNIADHISRVAQSLSRSVLQRTECRDCDTTSQHGRGPTVLFQYSCLMSVCWSSRSGSPHG